MRYTWDPVKDAVNRGKHGLPLADGIPALRDPNCDYWTDDRFDYEEERLVTLGKGRAQILVVVTTERDFDTTHIISVRKADGDETSWYYFGRP
jgi:uncharacterized DUF497 family protein